MTNKLLLEKDVDAAYRLFYGRSCTVEEVRYAIDELHNFYFLKEYIVSSSEFNSRKRKKITKNILADKEMIEYAYIILLGRYVVPGDRIINRINTKQSLYMLVNTIINGAGYNNKQVRDRYFSSDKFNSEGKIIYLHIPKCAGASFSVLATENDGENVFLTRGGSFDKSSYYGKRIIGGHREINYYDASSNSNLYLTVLRDPVKRAISYFNYYKYIAGEHEYNSRIEKGFNPNDILDTVKNSGIRLEFINNLQCRYISAHHSYEDAVHLIKKNNMILTTMEHLNEWTQYIANVLGWSNSSLPLINRSNHIHEQESIGDDVLDYLRNKNSDDFKIIRIYQ